MGVGPSNVRKAIESNVHFKLPSSQRRGCSDGNDDYVSSVQCPVEYTMFDCSSYLEGTIGECMNSDNEDVLYGEYYFREKLRSKSYCKAVGETADVRAQAVCCGLF